MALVDLKPLPRKPQMQPQLKFSANQQTRLANTD